MLAYWIVVGAKAENRHANKVEASSRAAVSSSLGERLLACKRMSRYFQLIGNHLHSIRSVCFCKLCAELAVGERVGERRRGAKLALGGRVSQ